ncbi:hypothetical protein OIDMADRAFT_143021 [Oidiodendron maius Zn]|uniref:Extracellular membrane protein CFEM domain-containing protein n=1 Tax=Oidiodendron maius (strain Zn) TaxID=913774 RepID=A0A0C3HB30_OIDMZ|nr:hypothetical protein OIDMADRAFT_143021 [Oidiodendron maius Zn]
MRVASLLALAGNLLSLASATTQSGPVEPTSSPDGALVPFSTLPPCASLCGPLFDAQGACSPPVLAEPSQSCFCSAADLSGFLKGTAGVADTCGPEICQDTASLQEILNWYEGFCDKGVSQPTGTSTISSTSAEPSIPLTSPVSSTSSRASSASATGTSTKTTQSVNTVPTSQSVNTAPTSQSTNAAPSSGAGNRVAVGYAVAAGLLGYAL